MDEQAGSEVKTEGAASTVKQGVISSLRGLGEIEAEIVALVRNTVSGVLKNASDIALEATFVVRDVLKGAIGASEQVGTGLVIAVKNVIKGAVMGVGDAGGDVGAVVRQAVSCPGTDLKHAAGAPIHNARPDVPHEGFLFTLGQFVKDGCEPLVSLHCIPPWSPLGVLSSRFSSLIC